LGGYAALDRWGLDERFMPILTLFALLAILQIMALVSMERLAMRGLKKIGERTLPIYIFHLFGIYLLGVGARATGLVDALQPPSVFSSFLIPPLIATILILISRMLGGLILGSRVDWLLNAPRWLVASSGPKLAPGWRKKERR
jgi:uncharacterized membrane protein YcfT